MSTKKKGVPKSINAKDPTIISPSSSSSSNSAISKSVTKTGKPKGSITKGSGVPSSPAMASTKSASKSEPKSSGILSACYWLFIAVLCIAVVVTAALYIIQIYYHDDYTIKNIFTEKKKVVVKKEESFWTWKTITGAVVTILLIVGGGGYYFYQSRMSSGGAEGIMPLLGGSTGTEVSQFQALLSDFSEACQPIAENLPKPGSKTVRIIDEAGRGKMVKVNASETIFALHVREDVLPDAVLIPCEPSGVLLTQDQLESVFNDRNQLDLSQKLNFKKVMVSSPGSWAADELALYSVALSVYQQTAGAEMPEGGNGKIFIAVVIIVILGLGVLYMVMPRSDEQPAEIEGNTQSKREETAEDPWTADHQADDQNYGNQNDDYYDDYDYEGKLKPVVRYE